ncbi:CIC family chloride channel protein [Novosphingobium hassiacum]|uniref:CIC family chloride channel protein n=2 Tax=Novosphingobium hassiacum TaxID=173676 RepID=A0A7W5ZYX4_9SPHN|nr:CIC family chloride channel protein [Novosphingobium hassiacum]
MFRVSEVSFILLATVVGIAAGLVASLLGKIARALQIVIYGLDNQSRLSSLTEIAPMRLLALPLGGLLLGLGALYIHRRRAAVDVVEANALHGGRIPVRDTLLISAQTLLSNGCGASVGLEAAYAQSGGGIASWLGQALRIRRADLRVLVGAGAGAAIAAAFGAPLAGAFYAFEIVIGAYTPASIAPVAAATISAVITARALGATPYLIAASSSRSITTADYLLYAGFGLVAAIAGIVIMRLVSNVETWVRRSPLPEWSRPALGGVLLMPVAWVTPHALSAGHGALHLTIDAGLALRALVLIFVMKTLASVISLGFGFRGGLFFASLFLGALLGQILAALWMMIPGAMPISYTDAALVGMAALAVAIVGGPMTMSLLVLEATHDFEITATVLTASLCASALVRDRFGYSFSTWRLHLRGEVVRSARDIGWMRAWTARRMMRGAPPSASATLAVEEFRRQFPLGSTSRVLLIDEAGRYAGMVPTAVAFTPTLAGESSVGDLAILKTAFLSPEDGIGEIMRRFEESEADDLAVVSASGAVLGILTEKYVQRRYADEADRALREIYGEG